MNKNDEIRVNVKHIVEEGLSITGNLPPSIFDMGESDRLNSSNPLAYDLIVLPTADNILVRGTLRTTLRCRCDRCLRYYDHLVENPDVCLFYEEVTDDFLDLTDDVREDILLGFPQKCLCIPDCRGLCPECGHNLNLRECDCSAPASPPGTFDKLDGLDL